jgi:hypothetical protein
MITKRTSLSLEDWAKLNRPTDKYMNSIAEMLIQENELMKILGPFEPREPDPWHKRARDWLGNTLVRLGFHIAPDVRDQYYD